MLPEYMENYATRDYAIRKVPHSIGPFDSRGVPLVNADLFSVKSPPIYHPVVIAQYALGQYELWRSGQLGAKDAFLVCASWLEDNAVEEPAGRFAIWPYHFQLRSYKLSPPWKSGMAQGQGLSVLVRSYLVTRSTKTANAMHRVALSFLYPVEQGGVLYWFSRNSCFIEEIAVSPAIHILNGCLFAMFGIYEYLQLFSNDALQNVLDSCIRGVEQTLPLFDCGWWSRYSLGLRLHLAPQSYHLTHILQLRYLAGFFNRPLFAEYASRWEHYSKLGFNRLRFHLYEPFQINTNRLLYLLHMDFARYSSKIVLD